jgi:hypothetical protein
VTCCRAGQADSAMCSQMEKVKRKLKTLCRPGHHVRPEFAWPAKEKDPFEVRSAAFLLGQARN